jgi:hypothetical protein
MDPRQEGVEERVGSPRSIGVVQRLVELRIRTSDPRKQASVRLTVPASGSAGAKGRRCAPLDPALTGTASLAMRCASGLEGLVGLDENR